MRFFGPRSPGCRSRFLCWRSWRHWTGPALEKWWWGGPREVNQRFNTSSAKTIPPASSSRISLRWNQLTFSGLATGTSVIQCGTMRWFQKTEFYISLVSVWNICEFLWRSISHPIVNISAQCLERLAIPMDWDTKRMEFCGLSGHLEPGAHPLWQPHLFGQLLQHLCLHLPHNKVTATIELQQQHCNNCNVTNTLFFSSKFSYNVQQKWAKGDV